MRRITITYFSVMMTSRLQKIRDSTPSTAVTSAAPPATAVASRSAYSGLVPMSPYTTPSAPSVAADRERGWFMRKPSGGAYSA